MFTMFLITMMVKFQCENPQTIISHLNSMNIIKKTMTYDIGNLGPVLGDAQECGIVFMMTSRLL
jgi:hypothetical protein